MRKNGHIFSFLTSFGYTKESVINAIVVLNFQSRARFCKAAGISCSIYNKIIDKPEIYPKAREKFITAIGFDPWK